MMDICVVTEKQKVAKTGSYHCETYGEKVDKRWILKIIDQSELMASELLAEMFCKHAVRGLIITESEHVPEY